MNPARPLVAAVLCAATLIASADAAAQGGDALHFQASIYGYLPATSGSTTFPPSEGGGDVSIDMDPILEYLELAFMGSLEVRKGDWGAWTDIIYLDFGNSRSGSRAIGIGNAGLPAGASANVDYDLKGWMWTLGGAYQAVARPGHMLDVIGGMRVLDIRQALDWQLSGEIDSIALVDRAGSREASQQNRDVVVGVKGRASFGDGNPWFVPYYVDLGTGDSQFTWQASAGLGYGFRWGDIVAAWRTVDYDMKSGKTIEDLNFNGPSLAVVFRW